MGKNLNRRAFLAFCTKCVAVLTAGRAAAAIETPQATEGPYYPAPSMRFEDIDNDLVKIAGMVREAGGEVITLSGRILDEQGQPRTGYRIEIWQCDVNGRYMHPRDRNAAPQDFAFQGFGHDVTDADGRYEFRTIKPVSYPGRTPHIHVKVFNADGSEVLTSQFYIAGHRENARDRLYRSMSDAEAQSVSMTFDGGATTVDVVV
jgi:protocatechuate 3,4-dioxygenase beta subunit